MAFGQREYLPQKDSESDEKPEVIPEKSRPRLELVKPIETAPMEEVTSYILNHPKLQDKGLFAQDILQRIKMSLDTADTKFINPQLSRRERILGHLVRDIKIAKQTPSNRTLDLWIGEELERLATKPPEVVKTFTQPEITPAMLKEKFIAGKPKRDFVGKPGSASNDFFTTGENTDKLWSQELDKQYDKQLDEAVELAKKQPTAPWTTRAIDWLVKKVTFEDQRQNISNQKMFQKEEKLALIEENKPELYKLTGLLDRLKDEFNIEMSKSGSMGFWDKRKYEKLQRSKDSTFLELEKQIVAQLRAVGKESPSGGIAPLATNRKFEEPTPTIGTR